MPFASTPVAPAMTIGVALPLHHRIDATAQLAREAHEAGSRSAWFGQTFAYDSPSLAAIIGREVPGLHVGTAAIPVFGRHPLLVSSQAQTAEAATGGRYHLGIALGTRQLTETGFGIPYWRPIRLLREFLTALRQLVETGSADFHGELLTAATPMPAAVPGAEPPVPILVAAMGPQALRASGELADGILACLAGPRALAEHVVPAVTAALGAKKPRAEKVRPDMGSGRRGAVGRGVRMPKEGWSVARGKLLERRRAESAHGGTTRGGDTHVVDVAAGHEHGHGARQPHGACAHQRSGRGPPIGVRSGLTLSCVL